MSFKCPSNSAGSEIIKSSIIQEAFICQEAYLLLKFLDGGLFDGAYTKGAYTKEGLYERGLLQKEAYTKGDLYERALLRRGLIKLSETSHIKIHFQYSFLSIIYKE